MEPLTPEQLAQARKQISSEASKTRWANKTAKERHAHGLALAAARRMRLGKRGAAEQSRINGRKGGRPKKQKV